jgi:transcriptional regulator GlxA family with amidase domain
MVFEELPGVDIVGVGGTIGHIAGQGGGHHVDELFDDVRSPDVVIVPGGLGCARTAADERLLDWLRMVAPRCQWMAASSTGTVVVAAAGLLDGRPAATHWLASTMLASFGSPTAPDRIVEVDNIITCEGQITALHVALLVTLRIAGPDAVRDVREALARRGSTPSTTQAPLRWRDRRRRPPGPMRPRNPQLVAPDVIEFESRVILPNERHRLGLVG